MPVEHGKRAAAQQESRRLRGPCGQRHASLARNRWILPSLRHLRQSLRYFLTPH